MGSHTGRASIRLRLEIASTATRTLFGWRQRAVALERVGVRPLCGQVELSLKRGMEAYRPGEIVIVRARLRPAMGARNPRLPNAQLRFLREGIGARITLARAEQGMIVARRSRGVVSRLRRRLRRAIDSALPDPSRRAVISALVLGDRHAFTVDQRRRFARAGVSHLLAVSGLHLSLVSMAVLLVLRWLLRRWSWLAARIDPRGVAAIIAAMAAVAYTLLTGAAPSTLRACIMVCALFMGLCARRSRDAARPLALAALITLSMAPLDLLRPAFQLSYAAIAGLLIARSGGAGPGSGGVIARLGRALLGLLMATAAATLVTWPIAAFHFGQISLAGLLVNLIAIPLTTLLLLPLSILGALLSLCGAGAPILRIAGFLAGLLDGGASLVSNLSVSALSWRPSAALAAASCAAALAVFAQRFDRPGRRRWLALTALLLVVTALAEIEGKRLRVTFIDVGQGDAVYLRLPKGGHVLVDGGGSRGVWDPGRARVLPLLQAHGVRQLDLVVATHPHADHVGGLFAVIDAIEVKELWLCYPEASANPWIRALRLAAARRGVRVGWPRRWQKGGVEIEPLWPRLAGGGCGDPALSANDNSVVLRVRYGRGVILLAGDVEADAEAAIVASQAPSLRAQVLKVPHHGSSTSSTPAFLGAVAPELAVISCGLQNRFGLPHARVIARYRRSGVRLLRTDQRGAVTVAIDAEGGVDVSLVDWPVRR